MIGRDKRNKNYDRFQKLKKEGLSLRNLTDGDLAHEVHKPLKITPNYPKKANQLDLEHERRKQEREDEKLRQKEEILAAHYKAIQPKKKSSTTAKPDGSNLTQSLLLNVDINRDRKKYLTDTNNKGLNAPRNTEAAEHLATRKLIQGRFFKPVIIDSPNSQDSLFAENYNSSAPVTPQGKRISSLLNRVAPSSAHAGSLHREQWGNKYNSRRYKISPVAGLEDYLKDFLREYCHLESESAEFNKAPDIILKLLKLDFNNKTAQNVVRVILEKEFKPLRQQYVLDLIENATKSRSQAENYYELAQFLYENTSVTQIPNLEAIADEYMKGAAKSEHQACLIRYFKNKDFPENFQKAKESLSILLELGVKNDITDKAIPMILQQEFSLLKTNLKKTGLKLIQNVTQERNPENCYELAKFLNNHTSDLTVIADEYIKIAAENGHSEAIEYLRQKEEKEAITTSGENTKIQEESNQAGKLSLAVEDNSQDSPSRVAGAPSGSRVDFLEGSVLELNSEERRLIPAKNNLSTELMPREDLILELEEMRQKLEEAVTTANNNSALVDSHYSRGEENRLATEESNKICEVLSNSIDAIYEIVDQAEDLETVSSIRTKIMNIEKDANAKIEAIQEKYGSGIMAIQNTSEQDSKPEEGSSFPNNSPAITDSKQVSKQNQRQIQ